MINPLTQLNVKQGFVPAGSQENEEIRNIIPERSVSSFVPLRNGKMGICKGKCGIFRPF